MAPLYKLTYFDARALTEVSRFLLNYGGIEFEDVRIQREKWPQMKDKTPFGQLPILEHNGKKVNQSISIARYLAKVVKLAGNDDWENLEIDAVVDTINDFRAKLYPVSHEQNEAKKKVLKEAFVNETVPYYLSRLDTIAQKNKGHLALGRLTWADFYLTAFGPMFDNVMEGDAFVKYPNLKAVRNTVENIPAIKKWIEVRPKTMF